MKLDHLFPATVADDEATLRLDQWLAQRFPDVSRARWARLVDDGRFFTEGKPLQVAGRVRAGQVVEFVPPEVDPAADDLARPERYQGPEPAVVFEDETLLVVDKPVDLAVHPGSGVPLRETLVSWLLNTGRVKLGGLTWDDQSMEEMRPGIVHRLDRGTSGLLVVAKNPDAHVALARQFAERAAGRRYNAVVMGRVTELAVKRPQRVDSLLQRDPAPLALRIQEGKRFSFVSYLDREPSNRLRFRVAPETQGKKAITHFWELGHSGKFSVVELKLETGRTHQIRAHLSFLGYPILGDTMYNGMGFRRIMLHARHLTFIHPKTGTEKSFESHWPTDDAGWLSEQGLPV